MVHKISAIQLLAAGLAWLLCFSARAEEARFDILEYLVEGNSTLSVHTI